MTSIERGYCEGGTNTSDLRYGQVGNYYEISVNVLRKGDVHHGIKLNLNLNNQEFNHYIADVEISWTNDSTSAGAGGQVIQNHFNPPNGIYDNKVSLNTGNSYRYNLDKDMSLSTPTLYGIWCGTWGRVGRNLKIGTRLYFKIYNLILIKV